MENHFYVHVSSSAKTAFFDHNKGYDFLLELSENIILKGKWSCALFEMKINIQSSHVYYLCADICEPSIVDNKYIPLLRQISRKVANNSTFSQLQYIPIVKTEFNTIRVYIVDTAGQPTSVIPGPLHCTLQFIPDTKL